MGYEPPKTSAQRVAKRRAALRAQGLRPKTFWVPDTSTPQFREQVARACAALAASPRDGELEAWMDAMVNEALRDLPPPRDWDV
jgi:DNA-binding LacI/PurR family transcriptional regulator